MNAPSLSRRSFVSRFGGAALGAVVAPQLLTSGLRGASGVPASERVGLGFIGVGYQGAGLFGNFLREPSARIVGISDCFTSRRLSHQAKVHKAYGNKDCGEYRDFRDLLARPDIDAVVIATPDHWHVPIALAAIRAGKDVYVEKPLGLSLAENKLLAEAVRRHRRVFQYGTQQRSQNQHVRQACELVRNGYIGEVTRVETWCDPSKSGGSTIPSPPPADLDYEMWTGPAPMVPYTADRCTSQGSWYIRDHALGFIAGWGAHPLDVTQWGLGTDHTCPVSYEGAGTFPTEGLFDTAISWDLETVYANGLRMRFYNAPGNGSLFHGTEGTIRISRKDWTASNPTLLKTRIKPGEQALYSSPNHYRNFLECVKSRAETVSPVESALNSDAISHLSNLAIRTGRRIEWDPVAHRITNAPDLMPAMHRPMRAPWTLSAT